MPIQDLTSLDNVKEWLNEQNSNNDPLLKRLIRQASNFINNETNRPLWTPTAVSEARDGRGSDDVRTTSQVRWTARGQSIQLRRWPVLSISALTIDALAIPVAPALVYGQDPGDGYLLDPWDGTIPGNAQFLSLQGGLYTFYYGLRNISISYVAGYQVSKEAATVPVGTSQVVSAAALMGPWASDGGVTYANGTALTAVASSPAVGQYSVDDDGDYSFAAGDAGRAVLLTYGFIPSDIEQACIELVGERFSYRDRIGKRSQSLAGQEVTAYSLKDIPDYIKAVLDAYRTPVIG